MTEYRSPIKNTGVRRTNEKHLLRIMHDRGVVTQADMAIETGLQPSTVFRIFKSLEERETIQQVEGKAPDEPRQGRRPGYYELNPLAGFSMGVDLSHSSTAILLVDFKGNPVSEHAVEFPTGASARETLDQILTSIDGVLASEHVARSKLLGVGIGAPGVVDIARGEVVKYSRSPGMVGLPFQKEISAALDVPVFMHNNASVIALAENRFGRGAGHDSVVAYLLRYGVGGAFVTNGQLYTSQGMTAFEIGHTTLNVRPGGATLGGETLEDILSEGALVERARKVDPSVTDLDSLVACMRSEDSPVCRALDDVAQAFIAHARNIALVLNPEAFMIIARHRTIAEFFANRLGNELRATDKADRFNLTTVIPLEYDPILACRGAADLVFDRYFAG